MTTATLTWFARHESRLAWRDFLWMMAGGRSGRVRAAAIALVVFVACMHLLAFGVVGRYADMGASPEIATLVAMTGAGLMSWSLMMSQAMESATRAFYARADLDLILSSPVAAQKLFAVRIATMAVTVTAMATLLAAPFINTLALLGGVHWLTAYGVVAAMGASAAACGVAMTAALFRLIGPKRTRFVAQVVAAVVGAAFVIGLQIAAITSYGAMSRTAMLMSDKLIAIAPGPDSLLWWPARAMAGDFVALVAVMFSSLALLLATILLLAPRFGEHTLAAAGVAAQPRRQRRWHGFRSRSPSQALRRKEWALLRRDPWLLSQTLMQILYLIPPALFLWRSYSDSGALLVLVPVLVMAAGQLAGGLAWLVISGEDAPELIASAPVPSRQVMRAKIEAVVGGIGLVFMPFAIALAVTSPHEAVCAAAGIAAASVSATAIQFWFRTQAKRSHFRRRQTSSRVATLAEAFSSITWAAAAALAAIGTVFAIVPVTIALGILAGARAIRPRNA